MKIEVNRKKYLVAEIVRNNGWALEWEDSNGWHEIKKFKSYESAERWQERNLPGVLLMNNIPL